MRPVGRQLALILAVCAGFALAHVGTSTMPFQIGALIDGSGRTAAEAGAFGMLEVGALALGMIAISGWVARVSPLAIALVGCLLAALASMGLFWVRAAIPQMALAVIAGLGFGFVFAASVASAAATREPDRVYAIGNGGALLAIVGVMSTIPAAAGRFGPLGIFAALAALAVACASFSFGLRGGKRAPHPQKQTA
ncbi:MAG TPA: hypothetical protein VFU61_04615, partial [Steroidobacteraceae bacterium]|nr:hypothetical protein [Steroidobacteraceae bacterium]